MGENRFCIGCGEEVETNLVDRGGKVELTCMYCGFTLDIAEPGPPRRARCIITADDAEVIRTTLRDFLVSAGLADEVISACDGSEFVSAISRRLPAGEPVDLVILDIEMPVMDGFTAARVLRSLENKLGRRPCPIIFFSSHKAGENLKRQMALYHPVRYLNKGAEGDMAELTKRISVLVSHLDTVLAGRGGAPGPGRQAR